MKTVRRKQRQAQISLWVLLSSSVVGLLFLPEPQLKLVSAVFAVFFASGLLRREA